MVILRNSAPDFRVSFRTYAFPIGSVASSGELSFSANDLAHALFATGRAPGDEFRYGSASVYELLHRASLIPAYIRRTYHARLTRSDLALSLDRSEVTALSYYLGQAMTAIFCRSELGVSYLLHVDRYAAQGSVAFGTARRRADLFGLSSNGWVVAEAKGRSGGITEDLKEKIRLQKRSISAIDGVPPWLAVGCVANFPVRSGAMRLDAIDPDTNSGDALELTVDRDRYLLAYYQPFLRMFELGTRVQERDDDFQLADFAGLGIRIGLPRSLIDRVRQAESDQVAGLYNDVRDITHDLSNRFSGVETFPDGLVVETNWSQMLDIEDFGRFDG